MIFFSKSSKQELETCHPTLQDIFNGVILHHDCTILQGHRTEEQHEQYLKEGRTKVPYEKTKHKYKPSLAVDVTPYPIPQLWGEKDKVEYSKFAYFAGIVKGIAEVYYGKNIIRWGGDWDGDNDLSDQSFNDLVHFELIVSKKHNILVL